MFDRRWVLGVIVFTLLVIGLVAFARGRPHHRGQAVGEMAAASRLGAVVIVVA
jgi:hypothetical protein